MILIDSSVYIDWLRARVDLPRKLEPWLGVGNLWGCGIVLPLSDIVIGACAMTIGAQVITSDLHFQQIPGLATDSSLPGM